MEKVITRREKVEILVNFIKEHKRLPKMPAANKGISEYIYSDNMEIHSFYRSLHQCYKKAKKRERQGLELSDSNLESIKYFEMVKDAQKKYTMTKEKKLNELLKCIKNNFEGKSQEEKEKLLNFLSSLQTAYRKATEKQKKGKSLTDAEIENMEYYKKIKEVCVEYAPKRIREKPKVIVTKEEKVKLLQEYIKTNCKLPNNQVTYPDGTIMRSIYSNIRTLSRKAIAKQQNGVTLTEEDELNIKYYEEIQKAIAEYIPKLKTKLDLTKQHKITLEEKVNRMLEFIEVNHRLPKQKRNGEPCEYICEDGTDMYSLYSNLQQNYKKCIEKERLGQELTISERKRVIYFEAITEALALYNVSKEEKMAKLKEFISEKKRLPKSKKNNKGKSEYIYRDGTDIYGVYWGLEQSYIKAKEKQVIGQNLTKTDIMNIKYYEEIQELLKTTEEKTITEIAIDIIEEENLTKEQMENLRNALSDIKTVEVEEEKGKEYIKKKQI